MKKLESTWYNMAAVLSVIAIVAGAVLAAVNETTKAPIAQIKQEKLQDGIRAVLNTTDCVVEKTDTLETGSIIYTTDKGMAVQTSDKKGFGGTLTVLIGFDAAYNIQGYRVLETSETPGLGSKADSWFQKNQKGDIIGKNPGTSNMTVSKDGGDVDAITASTITSRAFLRCVNAAYAAVSGDPNAADGASGASTRRKYDSKGVTTMLQVTTTRNHNTTKEEQQ